MPVHIFSICAYKESPYLEDCIKSLLSQTVRSGIIICTSTPNAHIKGLSEKYGLPLYVRDGESSLKDDWNFAVSEAVREKKAQLVTVAHQDDIYKKNYVKALLNAYEFFPDMSVFCTAYECIDGAGKSLPLGPERVKRLLRLPLRLRGLAAGSFIKRLSVSLGNSICCPSCTYNIAVTGEPLFRNDYKFVIDWAALLRLCDAPGRFVCVEKPLLKYRIHDGAETKANIENHNREREEAEMFGKLFPAPVVRLLMHFYKKAYKEYE